MARRLSGRTKSVTAGIAALALTFGLIGIQGISTAGAVSSASPWSESEYNAAHSQANLSEVTLTASNVARAEYRRSVVAAPQPGCISGNIAGPVLTDGHLLAVMAGVVTNYDAATGRVVWATTPDPSFGEQYESIAMSGGVVLVDSTECGSVSAPIGSIDAFSLSTGAKLWSASIGGITHMVVSGKYVVGTGSNSEDDPTTVTTYRVGTGAIVWRRQYPFVSCGQSGAIVVAGKVLHTACTAAKRWLEADDLATGAKVWSHDAWWQVQRGDTDDVSTGHHIYMSTSTGPVVDVNPKNGATKFTLAGASNVDVVDAGRAYAQCGTGSVCGYDIATGGKLWTIEGVAAPVAEAGGALYLADGSVLDARTGTLIATLNAEHGPSAIGDGRIAVVDGRVLDLYGLAGS